MKMRSKASRTVHIYTSMVEKDLQGVSTSEPFRFKPQQAAPAAKRRIEGTIKQDNTPSQESTPGLHLRGKGDIHDQRCRPSSRNPCAARVSSVQ